MARGHLRPHGDGAWRLHVNGGTDPVTGRRRQISKVVRGSRKEAERALTKLLGEVDGGDHGPGGDTTFGQVLDAWLAHKVVAVEPTTFDTYRASAGYVTDHLRAFPVRKLTVAHLEQLYAHLITAGRKNTRTGQGPGLGRAAVGNVHAAIHNALELARRRGWITVNPAGDAEVPRGQRRIPTPAEPWALPALLAEAEKIHPLLLPTFIRASVCAGTRRSELHGLRWSGADFDRSTVTLRDVIVRAGNEWLVKPRTKTGEARTVILDGGTMDLLRQVYDQAFELAVSCGIALPKTAFVFTDEPDGAMPWKPATTARRFSRCCVAAGLPATTRIHDLRALCGTHLADSGVPIPVIGARLGHTLNSTTADIYVGRVPESDRLAAEVMGRLFDG
jgi:integrase